MKHSILLFAFYFLHATGCTGPKQAIAPVPVAVPVDTQVVVSIPETVYQDSSSWFQWPRSTDTSPKTQNPKPKTHFWDWPEASTEVHIRDTLVYVRTICKERTDTLRIVDTLHAEIPCPTGPSQTTGHGKGWLLAAAFAFVFLMTFISKQKNKE